MLLGRWIGKALLSLLLIWGIFQAQPASLGPAHSHAAGHCCDLCHGRHVPLLEALAVFHLPPPVAVSCAAPLKSAPVPGEPPLASSASRSPPA